jgi:hypothetical protein
MIFVQEDLTRTKTELAKAREEASKLKAQLQAAVKVSKENDKTAAKTGARIQSLETEKSQLAAAVQGKNIEIKAQADRTVKMEAEIRDLKQQLQQQAEALQREKARVQARSTLHRKQRQWEEDVDYDDEDDDELFVSSQQARKKSRLSLGKAGQPSLEATIQQQVADAIKRLVPSSMFSSLTPSAGEVQQMPQLYKYEPMSAQQRSNQGFQGRPEPFHAPVHVPVPSLPQIAAPAHVPAPAAAPAPSPAQVTSAPGSTFVPLTWPPTTSTWQSSPIEVQKGTPLGAALASAAAPQPPPARPASPAMDSSKSSDTAMFQAFMEFMASRK